MAYYENQNIDDLFGILDLDMVLTLCDLPSGQVSCLRNCVLEVIQQRISGELSEQQTSSRHPKDALARWLPR